MPMPTGRHTPRSRAYAVRALPSHPWSTPVYRGDCVNLDTALAWLEALSCEADFTFAAAAGDPPSRAAASSLAHVYSVTGAREESSVVKDGWNSHTSDHPMQARGAPGR